MATLEQITYDLGLYRPGAQVHYPPLAVKTPYKIEFHPTSNVKHISTLSFDSTVRSQKNPRGGDYSVAVRFEGVSFIEDKPDLDHILPFNPTKLPGAMNLADLYYVKPPSFQVENCLLFCGCKSFQFEYEFQLYKKGSTPAVFRPYHPIDFRGTRGPPGRQYKTRITPSTPSSYARPPNPSNPNLTTYIDQATGARRVAKDFVNPNNFMGYCKHVHNFINALIRASYLKMR